MSYAEGKGEPIPSYSCMLAPLQHTTFEDIVAKGEIALYYEQFLFWQQCFQLYLTIQLYFIEIFHVFVNMLSKSSASELLHVGKG